MTDPSCLLEMRGICKNFAGVRANEDVDLTLHEGEVLGLLGENGAGKTTLMNILFGLYGPDSGTINIDGQARTIRSPADALAAGVGMVHQHFHLVPRHTVLENLMVGRKGRRGRLNRASASGRLEEIGDRYGLRLDPDHLVASLTVGEQQRLEIVKALFHGARILVLDEPTSVLTPQETKGLFDAVRAMAGTGVGVIFISHKLHEVREITTRLAVMRAGRLIADVDDLATYSNKQLAELMCGHDLTAPVRRPASPGRTLLRLDGVSALGVGRRVVLDDISFELRAAEILGVAGVSGNGQRELAEVIAGIVEPARGRIEVDGTGVARPSPKAMRALRVAQIPEDRMGSGLLTTLPLSDSMVLTRVGQPPFSRRGILAHSAIRAFVTEQIDRFSIKAAGPDVRAGTLSGGNLQKALLARELACDPLVIVAAQPTRGLDVAAREFVHTRFLELRDRGGGVLLISEDLDELFEMSDRIAVMFEGRIVKILPVEESNAARIGLLMAGVDEAA